MKILKYLDECIEEILLVFLLSVTSSLTFAQVIMRYVVKSPLSWSEEIARFMFIWMVYIGISYGVKRNKHIKVDFIINLTPDIFKISILILSDIIFLAFSIFTVIKSYQLSMKIFSLGQISPALGIQMGYVYLSTVVGFTLVTIRLIQNIIMTLKDSREEAL